MYRNLQKRNFRSPNGNDVNTTLPALRGLARCRPFLFSEQPVVPFALPSLSLEQATQVLNELIAVAEQEASPINSRFQEAHNLILKTISFG